MKKLFLVLILVLVTASFAVAKEKTMTVKGKVASIDAASNTLVVKEKNKEVTLNLNDGTKIMFGKEQKGLTYIRVGDKIKASAVQEEGRTIAKSVRISTSR